MSNCHFVAGGSLIHLAASRLALRTPALRAATALTRPNGSAQRLPCGRHVVPTVKTIGPNNVVTNHCVEHSDHLAHHRHDHDLRLFSGGGEAIVEISGDVPSEAAREAAVRIAREEAARVRPDVRIEDKVRVGATRAA